MLNVNKRIQMLKVRKILYYNFLSYHLRNSFWGELHVLSWPYYFLWLSKAKELTTEKKKEYSLFSIKKLMVLFLWYAIFYIYNNIYMGREYLTRILMFNIPHPPITRDNMRTKQIYIKVFQKTKPIKKNSIRTNLN